MKTNTQMKRKPKKEARAKPVKAKPLKCWAARFTEDNTIHPETISPNKARVLNAVEQIAYFLVEPSRYKIIRVEVREI